MTSITDLEKAKYASAWSIPAYAENSPGAQMVDLFFATARPHAGQSVIDVGAGAGAASKVLKARGLSVTGFDLTKEAWDDASGVPLHVGSLWHGLGGRYDFAYCCDVMEHIPTEFVGLCIERILSATRASFFSIAFTPDNFGNFVGEDLHLTVRPFTWWRDVFRELGMLDDARDLLGEGMFFVRRP